MGRFDRIILGAFIPPLVLLAAGLVAMLAFWGAVDGPLPEAVRFVARWLPLALIVAGMAWGAVITVRLWRAPRSEPVAEA